ncbi:hypothetical protein KUCAC02_022645, partial [Chaenocephalus aceratus]
GPASRPPPNQGGGGLGMGLKRGGRQMRGGWMGGGNVGGWGRLGKKDHERGESVESLKPDGGRKGKKRMKGSEKEGGEAEEVGSEGENEVEVEMEEVEGGGEAEEVGNEGENEVAVEMGEVEEVRNGDSEREESGTEDQVERRQKIKDINFEKRLKNLKEGKEEEALKKRREELKGWKRISINIGEDTAGQERYRTITTAYYRGAMGFILMYDITNEESFNAVQDWATQIKTYSWDNAQVIMVGNKCDMDEERIIPAEKGKHLADHCKVFAGFEYYEASAKENINVQQVFERLVDIICVKMSERVDVEMPAAPGTKTTRLADKPAQLPQKCC